MLGRSIRDPLGVESGRGEVAGLGLLDLDTLFAPAKRTAQSVLRVNADAAQGLLEGTGGMRLQGYEIHMGQSRAVGAKPPAPFALADDGAFDGAVAADGLVFGSYLHGIFDNTDFTRRLAQTLLRRKGLPPLSEPDMDYAAFRQAEYDRLAYLVERRLDMERLWAIIDNGV
jgi:adenosylcobyric acid synthase